jgi:hypothetical protein
VVALAGIERVEIRDTVNAKHNGFAIDDELLVSVLSPGFDNVQTKERPPVLPQAAQV